MISYIKARAEASGLRGDGGLIERPERLVIVLVGAGLSDLPLFPLPWALPIAMWLLAAASLITVAQRLHCVRTSPGATDTDREPGEERAVIPTAQTAAHERPPCRLSPQLADWGYAAGWRVVRAMPDRLARRMFDAGALYAAAGGGPQQLRKNLARVLGVPPSKVPDSLMRASVASYARYWREAFRLPSMDLEQVGKRLDEHFHGARTNR